MKRLLVPFLALVSAGLACAPASAQSGALPDAKPKVVPSLIAERAAVSPGGTVTVALNEAIRKEWHTYWVNPGDSGAPTAITWHLPPGWTAGEIQWPYPKRLPVGPLMNFGYEDQVALLSDLKAPADAKPGDKGMLSADVMWLVCSDVCLPQGTHLTLPPAGGSAAPPPGPQAAVVFPAAPAQPSPAFP